MTELAFRLMEYLFFCLAIYLIVFVFTLVVTLISESFKEIRRRGKKG